MEYLGHKEIASVTLFELKLSEGELMVYEGCIDYVLKVCDDDEILQLTGCSTKEELKSYQDELKQMIRRYVLKEFLPSKYKD
ncbi:hypothetical protein O0555_18035 [Brevibacillus laterosporus]|uniref:hypothetical protein n=1 Tax=Brevibacillus laterosporus TaxID=1465 RepID=UPI000CE3EA5C|nr:hypothetical protein [Brevibacillus laterosporus]MBG9775991.1 hypothetical protein [Brevibacillus laterosporus]MBG9797555.1 hypothetical protein [Brevibacillus laterosporus]MCR8939228.1 hypothetical protein [Brevibacillus laterosporus]MCZ0841868.1 hypothetical protein [Brevibacillus laterosporus]MCZ0847670.1 hypothetical protein [Brevibacillus laterosporus]